jgi:hypothetical protein
MSKHQAKVTSTPVAATPVAATPAPVAATPKVVVAKYAAPATIANMAAVITAKPNPKQPSGAAFGRYAKFYTPGVTVGEFIAAYKAAGLSTTLARADLRWDLQHGFITLG